jgi:hypothetical protein
MSGVLLDSQGAVIKTVGLGGSFTPPIASFDGSNYWVIYCPYSGGTSGSVTECLGQRVSPIGTLVDAGGINLVTVSGSFASIGSKGLAFGNAKGLLAFSEFNNATSQHELHGVLINPDGTVAGTGDFPIAADNSTHLYPAVAFDGTNFLVVWQQMSTNAATSGAIYGVRVSTTGSVIDPAPIPISAAPNGQASPSVAFDGTNYLVVWLDLRNQSMVTGVPYPDVYAARVTSTGVLLDGPAATGGFPINSGGNLARFSPYVTFVGTEYLVTWASGGYASTGSPGIQAARVSTSGLLPSGPNTAITVSGPPPVSTFSQFAFPVIAAGSQRAAVVWLDNAELNGSQKAFLGALFSPF